MRISLLPVCGCAIPLCLLTMTACDGDAVAPGGRSSEEPLTEISAALTSSVDNGGLPGSGFMITSPDAGWDRNNALSWQATGIELPDSSWVHIQVTGTTSITRNSLIDLMGGAGWPVCGPECFPEDGKSYGPWGGPAGFRVHLDVRPPGVAPPLAASMRTFGSHNGLQAPMEALIQTASDPPSLWVRRDASSTAICFNNGTCVWEDGKPKYSYTSVYNSSGGLSVSARPIMPLSVSGPGASPRGKSVRFDATINGGFRQIYPDGRAAPVTWLYAFYDTLPSTAAMPTLNPPYRFLPCSGNVCEFVPPEGLPGRVFASTYLEGTPVRAISEPLKIRESILQLTCTSDRGSVSVTHGDSTPTLDITRGEMIDCKAASIPQASEFEVTGWSFDPGGDPVKDQIESGKGIMVVGGVITVAASVNGEPQSASVSISVAPRNWSDRTVPFSVREVFPNHLPERARRWGELGQVRFPPDGSGLSSALSPVDSGPNRGWWYLSEIPFGVIAEVYVNLAALDVGSEFWELQARRRYTDINGIRWCARDDVVPFIASVRAHEGSPPNQESHTGLFQLKLQELTGPAMEPLISGIGPHVVGIEATEIMESILRQAQQHGDLADTKYPIRISCEFRFFSND